jgi:hypothetical protein
MLRFLMKKITLAACMVTLAPPLDMFSFFYCYSDWLAPPCTSEEGAALLED